MKKQTLFETEIDDTFLKSVAKEPRPSTKEKHLKAFLLCFRHPKLQLITDIILSCMTIMFFAKGTRIQTKLLYGHTKLIFKNNQRDRNQQKDPFWLEIHKKKSLRGTIHRKRKDCECLV